jgi:TPR repeat protein
LVFPSVKLEYHNNFNLKFKWLHFMHKKINSFLVSTVSLLFTMLLVTSCGDSSPKYSCNNIVELEKASSEQGITEAESALGICYYTGEGVTKDLEIAVELFQKAADKGNAEAQNNLGVVYYQGEVVTKDLTKSVIWYQKAADQGYAEAQNSLGVAYSHGEGVTQDLTERSENLGSLLPSWIAHMGEAHEVI